MPITGNVTFSAAQTGGISPLGIGQEFHVRIDLTGRHGIKPLLAAEDRLPLGMILDKFLRSGEIDYDKINRRVDHYRRGV